MDDLTARRLRRLTRALAYAVVVAVPIGVLAYLVRSGFGPLARLDERVSRSATGVTRDSDGLHTFLDVFQLVSQPVLVYLLVGLPVAAWVWWRGGRRTRAWWGVATMAIGWLLSRLLKELVQRARPVIDDPFGHHEGYSFPSGHASNNAVLVTAVLIMLWPFLVTAQRRIAVAVGVVWVVVTCLDRIFLGAHFLSDVVAGVIFGAGLVLASYAGYRGWSPAHPEEEGAP